MGYGVTNIALVKMQKAKFTEIKYFDIVIVLKQYCEKIGGSGKFYTNWNV